MSVKRIIVFGATGMLGTYVVKYFRRKGFTVIPVTREQYDIQEDDYAHLHDFFRNGIDASPYDVVVNCAGVIKQRAQNRLELLQVNAVFPHLLGKIVAEFGCKYIHITTDCVFSGKGGKYIETDPHDATDDYGRTKSLGEPISGACVIRTSIIGEELKNKLSLLEWSKSQAGKKIQGYKDHWWSGVTALQLAKFIRHIIENNLYWSGVQHYHTEPISKYSLLYYINRVWYLDQEIEPVRGEVVDRSLVSLYPNMFEEKYIKYQLEDLVKFNLYEKKDSIS